MFISIHIPIRLPMGSTILSFLFLLNALIITQAEESSTNTSRINATTSVSPLHIVQSFPTFTAPTRNQTKKSKQDEIDILPQNYYRDVAPMVDDKPVKVTVSVIVLNIKLSPESTQTFDADIFYHNYWSDHRLQKPTNEHAIAQRINLSAQESLPQYKLSDSWRSRLWVPDTYFRNAIGGSISNILTPTYYLTITNYTEVFMAVRLSLKLSCEMDFAKFPFDKQTCFFNISMTSEDINTVVLEWDHFRVGSHVDVTEFEVIETDYKQCSKYLDIGIFSCLYGKIVFKRNIGNYLIKRFIPSFIIVVMTFIGFWIPTTVSPSRTTLPITGLLAMITQQIQSDLSVSYVYALQVWNIVCIIFIFANLLEFAISIYVYHMSQKKRSSKDKKNNSELLKEKVNQATLRIQLPNEVSSTQPRTIFWWTNLKAKLRNHFRTTNRNSSIDYISRYLFPFAYFVFVLAFTINCVYY